MSFALPNPPPVDVPQAFLEGRQLVYTANIQAYGGNSFAVQLGNWGGLSTVVGAVQGPTYSNLNAVTAIPRAVLRAAAGAAAEATWMASLSTVNRNSPLFPGVAGDSGLQISVLGGIDANVSTITATELVMGAMLNGAAIPSTGVPITTAAAQWFGLYSEAASPSLFIGYKLTGGAIVPLTAALPLTWSTFQGWRIVITCDPDTLETSWQLQQLTGVGTWADVSSGATAGFQPGRVPFAPIWSARKTVVGENLDLWINSVIIKANSLGSFSLS